MASLSVDGARWAYFSVVWIDACPNNAFTRSSAIPSSTRCEA